MSSNVEPAAPPVPQWLLTGADQIAARYVMRGVSLYGLVYAAFIAGWEAGREEKSEGDFFVPQIPPALRSAADDVCAPAD